MLVVRVLTTTTIIAASAHGDTESCNPTYWEKTAGANHRILQLKGINLNADVKDITGQSLGAPSSLTIDQAVKKDGNQTGVL